MAPNVTQLVIITSHQYTPQAADAGARRGQIFVHILEELLEVREGRLLDLGCGPCLFAQRAQACGFQVTAVDARSNRVPPRVALGSITFIREDVREFETPGFDVICLLGLLYHLTLDDQLALLRKCRGSIVIIDTQFCEERRAPIDASSRQTAFVQEQGYRGVHFPEGNSVMAGWGNESSFWHTERSLLKMVDACGFEKVMRVVPQYSSKYGPRGFFVLDLP